jgi:hypothetical protein
MSATSYAIFAILSLAFAIWMFLAGRDPKRWRLLWLDAFGILDSDTSREERHRQELQMRVAAFVVCLMFLAMCVSLVFWSVDEVRETHRSKSTVELELQNVRRLVEDKVRR